VSFGNFNLQNIMLSFFFLLIFILILFDLLLKYCVKQSIEKNLGHYIV